MNKYSFLVDLLPIIYPSFFLKRDQNGNEFVLLDMGQEFEAPLNISDKTQYEAVENHVHLFGKVREENLRFVREIATAIAENLAKVLKREFPEKSFLVFLTIDKADSTIIRFHQIWENEAPYYAPQKVDYGSAEVIEIQV